MPQPDAFSVVYDLERRLGASWPHVHAAHERTSSLHVELSAATASQHDSDASIVALGSVGRFEVTGESDIDWVLLIDGQAYLAHQKRILSIASSIDARAGKPVGREGTFGKMVSSHDLVQYIGGGDDTNANFTHRMLLLLESRPLGDAAAYDRVVKVILERYLTGDHGWIRGRAASGVPRFLLNDVLRYWRTIAVDYAYKQWTRDNKGWALRSAKLRLSRKLIYASGLISCFSLAREPWAEDPNVSQDERKLRGIEMLSAVCAQTPLDRLAGAFSASSVPDALIRLAFDSYDSFLGILSDGERRKHLEQLGSDAADTDANWAEVRELGSRFQDGLDALFFDAASSHYPTLIKRYGVF